MNKWGQALYIYVSLLCDFRVCFVVFCFISSFRWMFRVLWKPNTNANPKCKYDMSLLSLHLMRNEACGQKQDSTSWLWISISSAEHQSHRQSKLWSRSNLRPQYSAIISTTSHHLLTVQYLSYRTISIGGDSVATMCVCAAIRDRTRDLKIFSLTLSQLSYYSLHCTLSRTTVTGTAHCTLHTIIGSK